MFTGLFWLTIKMIPVCRFCWQPCDFHVRNNSASPGEGSNSLYGLFYSQKRWCGISRECKRVNYFLSNKSRIKIRNILLFGLFSCFRLLFNLFMTLFCVQKVRVLLAGCGYAKLIQEKNSQTSLYDGKIEAESRDIKLELNWWRDSLQQLIKCVFSKTKYWHNLTHCCVSFSSPETFGDNEEIKEVYHFLLTQLS